MAPSGVYRALLVTCSTSRQTRAASWVIRSCSLMAPSAAYRALLATCSASWATCSASWAICSASWHAASAACAADLCARGTDAVEAEWAAEAAREYGERCQEDAEAAAGYARRAVDEAMRGHLQTAITLVRGAWNRGRPYDVGSAYSPLYTVLSSVESDVGSAWDDE